VLKTLIKRVGIKGATKPLLPVVPWLVVWDAIEVSYSVYKIVREAHENRQKRTRSR
jgi:hypothetical protein